MEGEDPGPGDTRGLTRRGYLSKWAFTTAIDPRAMLEHFLLLGFRGDPAPLFCISRPRRAERKSDAPGRRVFQVCLYFNLGIRVQITHTPFLASAAHYRIG